MITNSQFLPPPLAAPYCYIRNKKFHQIRTLGTARYWCTTHPSGDPTPSRADVQMTQAIVEVARPLGIAVHDHIIVGRDGHASLKGLKLI